MKAVLFVVASLPLLPWIRNGSIDMSPTAVGYVPTMWAGIRALFGF